MLFYKVSKPHKGSPNATPKHETRKGLLYNSITFVVKCADQPVLCRIQDVTLSMDIFLFLSWVYTQVSL